MEYAIGLAILASVVQFVLAAALWCEVRAFRQLNEGLGAMIVELEAREQQMVAGIVGAINARAAEEDRKSGKETSH
jgi:hypothetical protein